VTVIKVSTKNATKRLKMEAYFVGNILDSSQAKCKSIKDEKLPALLSDKPKLISVQKTVKLIVRQRILLFPFFHAICYFVIYPDSII